MKNTLLFLAAFLLYSRAFSQQVVMNDSSATLEEVQVRSFEQQRKQSQTAVNAISIQFNNGDRNNKTALVSGFNTIAGVRMEERSPGSYRINIRGSSLRSPFGVRNVKVYWNDIPLTDPGGNTYFNQFAYNNFSSIQIFKGPAGSMYGAGIILGVITVIRYSPRLGSVKRKTRTNSVTRTIRPMATGINRPCEGIIFPGSAS
jgi:iron complex outermembrane recepter protein